MGVDDKIKRKVAGKILKRVFGQVSETFVESGILAFLISYWLDMTIKQAIVLVGLVVILTISKKLYYSEDFYLAFSLMFIFHGRVMVAWFLYMYISYFRGITINLTQNREPKILSSKFLRLKSGWVGILGQYILPLGMLTVATKNRELRENIFFLTLLAFWHHLNYFLSLLLDIVVNRNSYTKKEVKNMLLTALKKSKINILITIIFFLIFKNIIMSNLYEYVSWGIIDDIFYWLSWII